MIRSGFVKKTFPRGGRQVWTLSDPHQVEIPKYPECLEHEDALCLARKGHQPMLPNPAPVSKLKTTQNSRLDKRSNLQ